jgi:hypothetical protein
MIGVGGQRHAPAVLPAEKDPVPIAQGAGWAPGQVLTGAKSVAPTGVRTPNRPACGEVAIPITLF